MERSKWMVFEDRKKIEKMYSAGKTVQEIAVEMKRNRATIYNELRTRLQCRGRAEVYL